MELKKGFLLSLAIPVILLGALFIGSEGNPGNLERSDTPKTPKSSDVNRTESGTKYIVHPRNLRQGCPGMDCIPSIDNPKFESAGEAGWMNPGDRVIGLEINGDKRAYPLKILSKHEIVNDKVGGEPVVVTYCPLCRSAVTYSRKVNGETLEFGVSGKLMNANLIMYDTSTESYWSQIRGKAIIGPRTPQELDLKFSSITNWSSWKKEHPETQVLSRNTGIYPVSSYSSNPYSGYDERESVGFGVREVDERLPSKALVRGISVNGSSKAYLEETVKKQDIIHDSIGGTPVLVLEKPDGTIIGFKRNSDEQKFSFTQNKSALTDSEGRKWSFDGEQVNGTGTLDVLVPQGFYWFAWSKFHPETEVYR